MAEGLAASPEINYDRLSMYLKALSNPNRLELLYKLRFPHTASEVTLTPKRSEQSGNPDRAISRQAVEEHLKVLQSIGVVTTIRSTREGRSVDEYVVNHPTLFAVTEELRKLSLIRASANLGVHETQTATGPVARGESADGPRLVLVGGVWEGKTFALRRSELKNPERGWVIGRKEGIAVSLDYDPFISGENSEILPKGNAYALIDLRSSRNGTFVNWEQLPKGGERLLKPGDLVQVGRSSLLFRTD